MSNVPETNEGAWSEENSFNKNHNPIDSDSDGGNGNGKEDHYPIIDPIEEQMKFAEDSSSQHPEAAAFDEDSEDTPIEQSLTGDTVGSYLSQCREDKGISLKNISQSTKISTTNLEFLEADQLEALPDRAYVTGYVKSYARALNADQKYALQLLEETYYSLGAVPREQEIVIPQAQSTTPINSEFPLKLVGSIVGGVLLLIAALVFFLTRGPDNEASIPEEKVVEEAVKKSSEIKPQTLNAETPLQNKVESTPGYEEGATSANNSTQDQKTNLLIKRPVVAPPETKPEKKAAEVKNKEEVKKQAKQDEEEVTEQEKKKFYPLAGNLYEINNSMSEERQSELLPSNFRVSSSASDQNIFITAINGDSWLTYKSDNDQIRKFVLKKDRSLLIRADEARIFLGNLGAVEIFLNNKPLKIYSSSGVKSLVFPQEKASNYVTPLFIYKEDGTVQTSSDYIKNNP